MPKISHTTLEWSGRESYSPWQCLYIASFHLGTYVEDIHILDMCTQHSSACALSEMETMQSCYCVREPGLSAFTTNSAPG